MGSRPICSAKREAFTAVFPLVIQILASDGSFPPKFLGELLPRKRLKTTVAYHIIIKVNF
jgi:hypothetical protein